MRLVIIESPYSGDIEANVAYARRALHDSISRGEAPLASHLLYTQPGVLIDKSKWERHHGMVMGWEWIRHADRVALYCDRGISTGMLAGLKCTLDLNRPYVFRWLDDEINMDEKTLSEHSALIAASNL